MAFKKGLNLKFPDFLESISLLINQRLFRKTNIKYWMNKAVHYVWENVKHVYVKQT